MCHFLLLQARLKFTTAHMDEANGSWRKDLWSDQTKVKLFGHNGKRHVWRSKGDVFSPKYTVPTVKHGDGPVLLPVVHCTLQVDGIIKKDYHQILELQHLKSNAK